MSSDPIRDYVRATMATHTREAIHQALTAAGHDPSRIDAVWQEEWRAAAVDRSVGNLRALSLSLHVLGALVGAWGGLAIVTYLGPQANAPVFWIVYAVGYLGIGYGISRLVRSGVRRFRLGGWRTFLLGAALFPAYFALMFGGCIGSLWVAQAAL